MDMDRRTLVKSAAWAAPVVALAVAAPAAAASTPTCQAETYIFDPHTTPLDHGQGDAVKITILTGSAVVFEYLRDVDSVDINVRTASGASNTHPNRAAKVGETITVPLGECVDPEWIQVHGNNVHYYGAGRFA